jgi:hypothetical protein
LDFLHSRKSPLVYRQIGLTQHVIGSWGSHARIVPHGRVRVPVTQYPVLSTD